MSADTKTQLRAAAVAIPVGFSLGCLYQMLKLKVGISDAVAVYTDVMQENVGMALGMCFIFYFFGMLSLLLIGHFGAKANRLLGMTPERD